MRYEGNTLREALGKALGTRDQYGRPKKKQFQVKQEETDAPVTSQELDSLRGPAIERAKAYIANADYSLNAPEDGYAELYLLDTREQVELAGPLAGYPVRTRDGTLKFRYDFNNYSSHPFYVLVFAHSHPRRDRSTRLSDQSYLCRPSRPVSGDPQSDQDLMRYAPLVIGCPVGGPLVHGRNRSFVPYHE